jgi:membrane protease YdiL (CAAX protease family)
MIAAFSIQSVMNHGLPGFAIPGLDIHVSRYLFVIVGEWIMILFIWLALKGRAISISSVVGGRWATARSFFIDFGLGCAFTILGIVVIGALTHLLGGNQTAETIKKMLPTSVPQVALWVLMSATAGFCEEFIFRGYFMRQFQTWTGSWIIAVVLQGACFGLGHGYYGKTLVAVATYGWLLGLLAHWRKSLRPGMIAHFFQDGLGGVLGYLTVK